MKNIIRIKQSVIQGILDCGKASHPREGMLLLRGETGKNIIVREIMIPPLATRGFNFSSFPLYMLPTDFSVIGTAHSHPSGILYPSIVDLNNFFGKIMIITTYPYMSESDIAVFNNKGNEVKYEKVHDTLY